MAKVTEGYLPYLGHQTYWRVVGDLDAAREAGVAPLVLLHGGPGSTHTYFEVLDDLADALPATRETDGDGASPARPLVMYDQIGCGNSYLDGHPELWRAETWLGELDALLADLHLDEFHLLGQSWGGMLAIQYACDYKPAGLRSLILSSTLSSASLWRSEQRRMVAMLPSECRAAIARADETGDYETPECLAATEYYMELHACDHTPAPDAPACLRRRVRKGRESYVCGWGPNEFTPLGTLKTWEFTDRLHEITAPTLIISGTDDLSTPLVNKTMFDALPHATWQLMAGARHMCFIDAHDRYERILRSWCDKHDDRLA